MGPNSRATAGDSLEFYVLLIECFERWPSELEQCPEHLRSLSESICKRDLLEPVDLGKESQFNQFEDLVEKYLKKQRKKQVFKRQATKEEEQLQKDLAIQVSTLQQLKAIFLEFIESAEVNEKSKSDFLVMLSEMKDLYNRIIGNKMYTKKEMAIDEVSSVLDVCNRYKGQFPALQEYVRRGGKWETALSKGIEEGLGRSSFGEKKGAKKAGEAKLQTSELVKFHTGSGLEKSRKSRAEGAKNYNNPFDNSSFEEAKPSAKKGSAEPPKKALNQSSSFKHLERDDSAHTMEELRNFILKEKGELENTIVSLKMKLERREQEFLEVRVRNEQQSTKIRSLSNENKDLQRQVKELKEEIYSRILNITMTSNKTGSASVNKFDSSHKVGFKGKYPNKERLGARRSTSFLSKPEDRIEKTRPIPELFEERKTPARNSKVPRLDKKSLSNSKAFLQDFNKEIDSILNRKSKAKQGEPGGRKRYGSQKKLPSGMDPKGSYMDLLEAKVGTYTASKPGPDPLRGGDHGRQSKPWDMGNRLSDITGGLIKARSQKYLRSELGNAEYGEVGGGSQYPARNRMAYTLNLGGPSGYAGAGLASNDFEAFSGNANRLNNRPHSMANHESLYNRRQMDMGGLGKEDPRFQAQFEEVGNFRGGRFPGEAAYNMGMDVGRNPAPGMGGPMERGGAFDAAKKLERYKNQMKMKHGDNGFGGRFY